jgi:hypothetical protein
VDCVPGSSAILQPSARLFAESEFAHVLLRSSRLERWATQMEHVAYFCLFRISLDSAG